MGVFGLTHKEADIKTRQQMEYKNQELQTYQTLAAQYKEKAKAARLAGEGATAKQYAGEYASYKEKAEAVKALIAHLERVNTHAVSKELEEGRNGTDLKKIIGYTRGQKKQADKVKAGYNTELKDAANELAKANAAYEAAMKGATGPTWTSQAADKALEEIVAEMETEKKNEAAIKGKIDQVAQAAAAAGAGAPGA